MKFFVSIVIKQIKTKILRKKTKNSNKQFELIFFIKNLSNFFKNPSKNFEIFSFFFFFLLIFTIEKTLIDKLIRIKTADHMSSIIALAFHYISLIICRMVKLFKSNLNQSIIRVNET